MHCDRVIKRKPISAKNRISGKKTSTVSTGKTKHFLVIFRFFHGTKYVIVSWKNPNFYNCIAKFGCGNGRKFSEFFQNFQKKSSKNCKRYKKYLKIPFFLKMRLVIGMVWHIFFPEICFYNFNFKKIFFWNSINFQKASGIPMTVTVTVSVTVTMIFEVHQSSGGLSTYIRNTKKNWSEKSMLNFSRWPHTFVPYEK